MARAKDDGPLRLRLSGHGPHVSVYGQDSAAVLVVKNSQKQVELAGTSGALADLALDMLNALHCLQQSPLKDISEDYVQAYLSPGSSTSS